MSNRNALMRDIEALPIAYLDEVIDFVDNLKLRQDWKKSEISTANKYYSEREAYQAMAADTERELEAEEWCNAYFGPICSG